MCIKESNAHEESPSADQEQDPEVLFQPSEAQFVPNMFMPYIEGPKMNWTVNDGLFHRFLKWHLDCENILECELAMLPERRQCKKVIALSGYLTWISIFHGACPVKTNVWYQLRKFEEFCKPQSNEARDRFDMLTSFQQRNKSVNEWYNVLQTQVALAKYPQKLPRYFIRTSIGSFLKMKSLSQDN